MARYRIYVRDTEGRIVSSAASDFASDHEACLIAESLVEPGEQAEVWQGVEGPSLRKRTVRKENTD